MERASAFVLSRAAIADDGRDASNTHTCSRAWTLSRLEVLMKADVDGLWLAGRAREEGEEEKGERGRRRRGACGCQLLLECRSNAQQKGGGGRRRRRKGEGVLFG